MKFSNEFCCFIANLRILLKTIDDETMFKIVYDGGHGGDNVGKSKEQQKNYQNGACRERWVEGKGEEKNRVRAHVRFTLYA